MAAPPGRPCFPHLHLKARLPSSLLCDVVYELSCAATNEMDMWDSGDTSEWGATLPVMQLQVLHPHAHAVNTPAEENSASAGAAASNTALASPLSSSSIPSSARLANASVRLAADCKPLLGRNGRATLRFSLHASPISRLSSMAPGTVLTNPFYLHLSIPGPLGVRILPALSGPHVLVAPPPKGSKQAAASMASASSYIMGEHGVHHAFFVPLDCVATPAPRRAPGASAAASTAAAGASTPALPSVYSFPANALNPPAFVRFKEILGVNLGGRIWDCGLLFFQYLRERILPSQPDLFRDARILEVGSGTGVVGVWLWAYVLLRNRRERERAEKSGTRFEPPPPTTFLLTDQEEAMDNLRDNLATNLQLLAGGKNQCEGVRIEASRLEWGNDDDHANLAIQSRPEPFDLILASDVVFNPIYFTPLLHTLDYISGPRTRILMAYRPRALDKKQDAVFWRGAADRGWSIKKEGKYEDVIMLTMERNKPAETPVPATDAAAQPAPAAESSPSPFPTPSPSPSPSAASSSTEAPVSTSASAAPVDSASSSSATAALAASSDATIAPAAAASSAPAADSSSASAASATPSPSPAPSSSPSSLGDAFDSVLSLHELDLASGAAEGARDALRQVEADGLSAGVRRGEGVAGELGFYAGFLHVLTLLREKNPGAYSDRVWTRAAKLHAALLQSDLYRSGFDPACMDDGSLILQLRNGFKALMTQMGSWTYFQQQAAQVNESISF